MRYVHNWKIDAVIWLNACTGFWVKWQLCRKTCISFPYIFITDDKSIVSKVFGGVFLGGAYRCSLVPLFTSPYVSQSRCSATLYSPVPIFPSPCLPPRGTPYVSQSLCFPVPLLPSPYVLQPLYSPVSIFPINVFPSLCSPRPLVPQTRSSPELFPVPVFPKDVPQSLCST